MIKKWQVTLPEPLGDKPRRAYVYIPAQAEHDPAARFPVLYMFDGHNVFFDRDATYGKSWGMKEYLERTGTPLMVAAVECNDGPHGERLSEYSPFDFRAPEYGPLPGLGGPTMEWFTRAFKPTIDARFPTLPDRAHTFIAGSSMGGLMSLYALTAYNHVFSGAAALSPSLMVAPDKLDALLRTAPLSPDTVLYMDYGSREMAHLPGLRMAQRFAQVTAELMSRGVHVTSRIVPGGEHCEASWERQIPFFMHTLLYKG